MRYCVKKDSCIVIDGSNNPQDIMIENSISAGFKVDEVEIITEEEYVKRVEVNKAEVVQQPTQQEILSKELAILKINDMKKDRTISDLIKAVADLKIKIMKMEGSN